MPYCRQHGIIRLEVFGATARGETDQLGVGNLMAIFDKNLGLGFFAMEEEISEILGTPVYFLTRESVETMSNLYRRKSILDEAHIIYQ